MKKNSTHFIRARIILLASLIAAGSLVSCGKTNFTDIEHIARAKDFQDQGDFASSVIELKGALKKNPDNAEARWLLGQIYVDLESGAAGEKELKRARELGVDPNFVLVPLGHALLQQNKAKQVLDEIQITNTTPLATRIGALTVRGEANTVLKQTEAAQTDLSAALVACGTGKCIDTLLALSRLELTSRNNAVKAREWIMKAIAQDPKSGKAWLYMGDLEQALNHPQEALDAYTRSVQANGLDLRALAERAHANLQLGKVDASKADLEKLRKLSSKYVAIPYLEGRHALIRKESAQAQAHLEAFMKATPTPSAAYYLAIAHLAQGHLQQANDLLAQLLNAHPGSPQARTLLANVQIQRGAIDDAIKTLEPMAKQTPIDIAIIKQLGGLFLRKGDLQTGVSYLQQALAAEPNSTATRLELGQILQAQGKTDLALAQFEAALQIKPDLIEAEVLRILTYLREQKPDAALQAIAGFKSRHPKSPVPDTLAAKAYVGKKDFVQARQSLEKALSLDNKYVPARMDLAQIALLQNDTLTARRHYQDILKQDSAHLGSMLALAGMDTRIGKRKDALNWLEKATQKHPKAIPPAVLLINAYLQENDSLKALALAHETYTAHPEHLEVLQALGEAQLAAGEINNALISFRKLTEKLPKSAHAHHLLGMAHVKAKDTKAALASFNKAFKLDPAMLATAAALSSMELKSGRPQEAMRIAQHLMQLHATHPVGYELEGDVHMHAGAYGNAGKAYAAAHERGKNGGLVIKLASARKGEGDAAGVYQTLTQWLTDHPEDTQVRTVLARAYQSDGKRKEAIEQYQKVLDKQPTNAVALNNLAGIYYEQDDPRALEFAEKAYDLAPNQPAITDTLGWILIQQKQVNRGLDLLQAAVSQSDAPIIRYHFAVALDKAGRGREARKELEQLLQSNSNFSEVTAARTLLNRLKSGNN